MSAKSNSTPLTVQTPVGASVKASANTNVAEVAPTAKSLASTSTSAFSGFITVTVAPSKASSKASNVTVTPFLSIAQP